MHKTFSNLKGFLNFKFNNDGYDSCAGYGYGYGSGSGYGYSWGDGEIRSMIISSEEANA